MNPKIFLKPDKPKMIIFILLCMHSYLGFVISWGINDESISTKPFLYDYIPPYLGLTIWIMNLIIISPLSVFFKAITIIGINLEFGAIYIVILIAYLYVLSCTIIEFCRYLTNMNMKNFAKPDKTKITLFILLCTLYYLGGIVRWGFSQDSADTKPVLYDFIPPYLAIPIWLLRMLILSPVSIIMFIVTNSFGLHGLDLSTPDTVVSIIYLYVLSCIITEVYKKVKK